MNFAIKPALHGITLALSCAALLAVVPATSAQADEYPSRTITLIVPFPPGGSSDIVMRLLAQKVAESLKQTIVIDNRPGGAGNVAAMAIKNAPPDGYLLMMGHTGTHAINPALYSDLKFDPVKDFQPITALISFNNILVVPEASPAKSVAELVALAKSKPDGLSYGSQGVGTGGHLLGELFAKQTGVKLVHVPYRGIAPAVTDTVAGRMDMLFASYVSTGGHIESRQAPHAGDRGNAAPSAHRGRSDHARGRISRGPDGAMVRTVRARRHAGRYRPQAQRRVRQGAAKRRREDQVAAAGGIRHPRHARGSRRHHRPRHRPARQGRQGIRRTGAAMMRDFRYVA